MGESRSRHWVRVAGTGFLVLIPLLAIISLSGVVAYWLFGIDMVRFGSTTIALADAPPVADRRLYGLIAAGVPLAFWLYALWRLFRLFLHARTGDAVALGAVRDLRAFALHVALTALFAFALSGTARWAMGRFDDAPLWTHLNLSPTHMAVLLLAAIVFTVSHIIEDGYGYRRETEDYV